MMREDFAAFILTHGRADRVETFKTLRNCGYTGKIYIVIDDEDKTADEYRKRYGDMVLQFGKADIAKTFDEGDNFNDRRAIIYARNACFDLARQVGVKYFVELDDDYHWFGYRFEKGYTIRSLDDVFASLVDFLENTATDSIAFSQGGDHIGGAETPIKLKRKAMNSFVCSTEKPIQFFGRINEDVNLYTAGSRRGMVFFTLTSIQLNQKETQTKEGGMTDIYRSAGTYIKSFYTVMYSPSCTKISTMGRFNPRLHHLINWNATAPLIIREEYKKRT
jgi:hypothetical protein